MAANNEGSIIYLALVVIIVLMMLVTSMGQLLNNELRMTSQREKKVKAFYLAEAGLEYATARINDNSVWGQKEDNNFKVKSNSLSQLSDSMKGDLESIKKELTADKLTISSKGSYQDATKVVAATYSYSQASPDYSPAFNYPVVGKTIAVGNNVLVSGGGLYAAGPVSLGNNTMDLSIKSNQGESNFNSLFPALNITELEEEATTIINSNSQQQRNSDIINGKEITYVTGDLNLRNNLQIKGKGILVVKGNLTIGNQVEINKDTSDYFLIIVTGDVMIGNNFNLQGLVYSKESITVGNNANIRGSIIANRSIALGNNLNFSFADSYLDTFTANGIEIPSAERENGIDKEDTKVIDLKLINWQEK